MKYIPIIGVKFFKGTLNENFFLFYLIYQNITSFIALVVLIESLEYIIKLIIK